MTQQPDKTQHCDHPHGVMHFIWHLYSDMPRKKKKIFRWFLILWITMIVAGISFGRVALTALGVM